VGTVARLSVCGLLSFVRMVLLALTGALVVLGSSQMLAMLYGVSVGWLLLTVAPERRAGVCVAAIAGVLGATIGRIAAT